MEFSFTYSDHLFTFFKSLSLQFKGSWCCLEKEIIILQLKRSLWNTHITDHRINNLHILKLVNPALGVTLPHLAQGLILVTPLLDILLMDPVHGGLTSFVPRVAQLVLQ